MAISTNSQKLKERMDLVVRLNSVITVCSPGISESVLSALASAAKEVEEMTIELAELQNEKQHQPDNGLLNEVVKVIRRNESKSLDDEEDAQAVIDELHAVFQSVELPHDFTPSSFIQSAREWILHHGDEGSIPLVETGIHLVEQLLPEL